jgi:MFS family permease
MNTKRGIMMKLSTYRSKGYCNVAILALAQMFAFTAVTMLMFIGSFIGADLAPAPRYATLPIASIVIGTALGTVPMALLMQRFGRKSIFILAIVSAGLSCFAISEAIELKNFQAYCGFIAIFGACLAGIQQFRFAAMESVAPKQMPTAASFILIGGIFAAFVGPELAIAGKNLTATPYQGSFYLVIISISISALLLMFYKQADKQAHHADQPASRPLRIILAQPSIWLAISSGAIGYAIMSFIMTATPISMHHMHGHSLNDTKIVIQSHIAFMFLPSLISPIVIRAIGLPAMILVGCIAYLLCIIIATNQTAVWAFWSSLVLLGIGWNFLFVAGTSLLPENYHGSEQYKVQALNDALIFGTQAVAAVSAGYVLSHVGWNGLLFVCIPPIMLLLIQLARHKQKPAG